MPQPKRKIRICKELAAAKKKKKDKDNNVSLEENLTCCARHILASQVDFKNQKPLLQEIIEAKGHKVVFYPKFHCELNYIEMYWGAAKRYVRQHCDYTWKDLQENIPRAFDSISLKQIRKYLSFIL